MERQKPNASYGSCALQTADGGYILAGSFHSPYKRYDLWVVKIDGQGEMLWNRTYGGEKKEVVRAIIPTGDEEFLLVGSTQSYGVDGWDLWIVKIDVEGAMLWNYTYGRGLNDVALSACQAADGGFLLVAVTAPGVGDNPDSWVMKIDTQGHAQWNKTYIYGVARGIIPTDDRGFILGGSIDLYSSAEAKGGMWVAKVDSNGIAQWNQSYIQTQQSGLKSIISTTDGGYLLAGWIGDNREDMYVLKIDSDGIVEWNQTYGQLMSIEAADAIVEMPDGGFVLVGSIALPCCGQNISVVKIDANGTEQWNQTYDGGSDADSLPFAITTSDGGVLLVGSTEVSGTFEKMWVVKLHFPGEPTTNSTETMGFTTLMLLTTVVVLSSWYKRKRERTNKHPA
jgi:hypothetical protein